MSYDNNSLPHKHLHMPLGQKVKYENWFNTVLMTLLTGTDYIVPVTDHFYYICPVETRS